MVLVDFAIDAIGGNAADVGIIFVAHLVGHEFHHLVFDAVALGILCNLFHVAGVLAQFLVMLLVAAAATLLIAGEQTMYHGVGVAAYGTGEVGVVIKCQTIVSDVVDAVFGLHHGA